MGRKRRRKQKPRTDTPDDYFAAGPFEFARFGRLIVSRSRIGASDWEEAIVKAATHLPTITSEIDQLVAEIAKQVSRLPGERLLHRAWWEFAARNITGGDRDAPESTVAMRMIDYVQSVIASVKPAENVASEVSEEEWALLSERVKTLFTRL
ncbi:MAG TPA: hypothetical protein VHA55_07610, partial [Pseudorhodoplanes sp.]|nr:hypothetical protein [Pseudorhodoplanes sp.]